MTWTTYSNPNFSVRRRKSKINLRNFGSAPTGSMDNFNMLNNLYKGRQDRIDRYRIYDWMDQDSDVSRALDIIAEHCTGTDEDSGFPFDIDWRTEDPTDEEATTLEENMKSWLKLNRFDKRLFRNVRSVLKYGDWFYFRNPKTFELYNLHPKMVLGALVDNDKMEVIAWLIRDFKFNVEDMEMFQNNKQVQDYMRSLAQGSAVQNCKVIPAIHIVHLTLNEGKFSGGASDDDPNDMFSNRWPFGESYLEQIYKTFKQRELIEDAAIIHRVQRAPTRRVWYIDVGKMRPDRATWVINNFKNELNQKRIPQMLGNNGQSVESVYNSQSQLEDYYIPVTADSRGSKVENLEGTPWGDLPDLKYLTMKMMRALRVPYSMLVGPEEGGSVFNDGKVGTAYMQEIEFSDFCKRIQIDIQSDYDFEFKLYMKARDVNVNDADFELNLTPPTNYDVYLQNMRDQDAINVWSQVKMEPWVSPRFAAIKYLGWSQEELLENERMKVEESFPLENQDADQLAGGMGGSLGGLGGMGDMGMGGLGGDMGMGDGTGMDGAGGMDGMGAGAAPGGMGAGMGGMGGMGGGGMGGAMGGARAGGGFGEGQKVKKNAVLLEEEDIGLSDIEPAEKKLKGMDPKIARTPEDELFGSDDPVKGSKTVTMKMLRNLRIAQQERREENQKRLKVIQKVYQAPAPDAGMGM